MSEPASESAPEAVPVAAESVQPRLIAVCNFKGGVGKTTACITIAAGLAAAGKRVTVVDFDALGAATRLLLGKNQALAGAYELLCGLGTMPGLVMPSHNDNISVLPATPLLHLAEMERAIRMLTPADLRARLTAGTPAPDAVVIDCGPGLGITGLAAIAAADLIIVPVTLDLLAVMGLERTLEVVAECAPETPFQILLNPIHGDGDSLIEDRVRRRYGAHVVKHRLQPLAPPRTALPGVQ